MAASLIDVCYEHDEYHKVPFVTKFQEMDQAKSGD